MTNAQGLFHGLGEPQLSVVPAEIKMLAAQSPHPTGTLSVHPEPDARLLEVYARAANPHDAMELRDLYLGRVECELGPESHRPELAERWRRSRVRREVGAEEVLSSRATVRFVKELFNFYFRDDIFGDLRSQTEALLCTGAVDEAYWGLPSTLKDCVRYALDRDWYGYSDSRGRESAREAVAEYETARLPSAGYTADNIALTMGATMAINSLADFILLEVNRGQGTSLCGIPNYPPLVESIGRRGPVQLVPLPCTSSGEIPLRPLIDALRPDTPIVLLQTVANPTGALVREDELELLIRSASPETLIILDECHEWLGDPGVLSPARAAPNVIRVSSLSKNWSAPGLKVGWFVADGAFIDEYYEYASTSFGGPPSFFYTLVEVLARMERWRVTETTELDGTHCGEFEPVYDLQLPNLQRAYDTYRLERESRESSLLHFREACVNGLRVPGITPLPPRYSINMAAAFEGATDSYLLYRQLLKETGAALFPGILLFCLSGAPVRLTTSRRSSDYEVAMPRLQRRGAPELRRV
ncbi:pyridoxal phosphate-dependent aminotransferase [Micromonospora sp. NPDC023644]|uniref:pyridoxal phosphate-dependent aminotransferase n=1 Tax=Micromonospora sp. NPDC023644 TaxID=3154321 RepID=UPI0033E6D23A